MSGPAWWVLSPLGCQEHVRAERQPLGELRARCGHVMPLGPGVHERRLRRPTCSSCSVITAVPPPQFPHKFPAGRRSSAAPPRGVPGGQPDPNPGTA